MLGISDTWKDWNGYSANGTAYFGINSIPVLVDNNVYQIKCLCSKVCNSQEYEMKYLQVDLDSTDITIEFLNSLKNNYIKSVEFYGYKTNNPNVFIVQELVNSKNIRPNRHNVKNINSLFDRLTKLKIQVKPILK